MALLAAGNIAENSCIWLLRFAPPHIWTPESCVWDYQRASSCHDGSVSVVLSCFFGSPILRCPGSAVLGCSPCLRASAVGSCFPVTRCLDHRSFTALCLRSSARDPTPHSTLLQTKAQPQFERTVDRAVEAFFCAFQRSNLAQIQPSFSLFTVRSAEGRNALPVKNTGLPIAIC